MLWFGPAGVHFRFRCERRECNLGSGSNSPFLASSTIAGQPLPERLQPSGNGATPIEWAIVERKRLR
jgi:hypothetical protein